MHKYILLLNILCLNYLQIIPGSIIDINKVPVDEKIINLYVNKYGRNKKNVIENAVNTEFNSDTTLYYLTFGKLKNVGYDSSVSDLVSNYFIDYISMNNKKI